MKKILFLLAAATITQTAFADIGTLYRSKTTDVKITKQGAIYKVDASLGLSRCSGDYIGFGKLNGNTLSLFDAATAKEHGGDASEYKMVIKFSNNFNQAKITHSPGSFYSGAACSFTDGGNPNLRKVR